MEPEDDVSTNGLGAALLDRLQAGRELDEDMRSKLATAIANQTKPSDADRLRELAEKQRQVARELLLSYKVFQLEDAMSMESIFKHRTEDCVQVILPRTTGDPERNNAQYRTYLQGMVLNDLAPFEGEVHIIEPIISDPETKTAIAKVFGKVNATKKTPAYASDTLWFLYFTKDGEKVRRIEVFVDSRQAYEFKQKLEAYKRKQKDRDESLSCIRPAFTTSKQSHRDPSAEQSIR